MNYRVFVIDKADNVATNVADEIPAGVTLEVGDGSVTTMEDIPYGHKIAIRTIAQGAPVVKYGLEIGSATRQIKAGEHVHLQNVESNRGRGDKQNKGAS